MRGKDKVGHVICCPSNPLRNDSGGARDDNLIYSGIYGMASLSPWFYCNNFYIHQGSLSCSWSMGEKFHSNSMVSNHVRSILGAGEMVNESQMSVLILSLPVI